MKIKGSVVLITGAARRVGRVLALELASRGADLVLHFHRSRREAESLKKQIEKKWNRKVQLIQGDLSDFQQLKTVAREAWRARGRLEVLVNNASTFYPTPLGRVKEKEWEDLFQVNARAPFFLSEYLGLKMKGRGKGKIINIADWGALRPSPKFLPYYASKAALLALSQGMARALAPEVQVNAVLPGPVMWPEDFGEKIKKSVLQRTPLGRVGSPEDIASAVCFLIEGNDFMTGSMLHVDGGRHIE